MDEQPQSNWTKDKQLLESIIEFSQSKGFDEDYSHPLMIFQLSNGSHVFSLHDPLDVWMKVSKEGVLSERLLVIVSVAYLEDQLRRLLQHYFADVEASRKLLDPNEGAIAFFVPMLNTASALGLIATEWYEFLKRVAQLRNKFAHVPEARSFQDLIDGFTIAHIQNLLDDTAKFHTP